VETPYACGLSPASGYSPVPVKFAAVHAKGYRDLTEGSRGLFEEHCELFEGSRDLLGRLFDLVNIAAIL
jgi:hypothetical protein